MSADENKSLVYRYFDEQWNRKNVAVIDKLHGSGMDREFVRDHLRGHACGLWRCGRCGARSMIWSRNAIGSLSDDI